MANQDRNDGSRKIIELPEAIAVKDLAALLGRKPVQVVTDLLGLKVMATVEQKLPFEVAAKLAKVSGFDVKRAG